jgi:hypothetical protein
MTKKSRWLAMLCIASLFIAVGGCSDDDDPIQAQQVDQQQAEAVVGDALDFLLTFGVDIADLIEAANAGKAGDMSKQQMCAPIPGLESEFFCTVPTAGEVCPVDEMTTEWVFSNCLQAAGDDPDTLDGTVEVTETGNVFDLDFDLDIDGGSLIGLMQVTLGECVTITYNGLEIDEDGATFDLDGSVTLCGDTPSGTLTVTANATGFQRFIMQVSFPQGIPTVVIISATSQEPLFTCTYTPLTESAQCFPFGDF